MATPLKVIRRAIGADDTSASLMRQISEARADQAAALAEAERLEQARLASDDFDSAESFARKAMEHRWRAERAQARIPDLERRLADARAREQAEGLDRHRKARAAIYKRLKAAVIACGEIQAEALRADQAAVAELGENLVRRHLPAVVFRGLVMPDLIELWAREMDRVVLNAPRPTAEPNSNPIEWYQGQNSKFDTTPPAAPKPRPRAARVGENIAIGHYGATASPPLEPQGFAKKHPDDATPLRDGNVRVRVVREGYPDSDGRYCHAGRMIQLSRATAEAAAKNGAVEILTESASG